jgi:hypothetical protein
MKLTKSTLKQLIKEEISKLLQEQPEEQARFCAGTKVWYQLKCRYPDEIKKIKRQARGRRAAGKSRKSRQEEKNQMAMARDRYKNYLEFKKLSGTPASWRVDEVVENLEAALQHFSAALKINPKNRVASMAIFSIPKIIATLDPQPESEPTRSGAPTKPATLKLAPGAPQLQGFDFEQEKAP